MQFGGWQGSGRAGCFLLASTPKIRVGSWRCMRIHSVASSHLMAKIQPVHNYQHLCLAHGGLPEGQCKESVRLAIRPSELDGGATQPLPPSQPPPPPPEPLYPPHSNGPTENVFSVALLDSNYTHGAAFMSLLACLVGVFSTNTRR